MTVACQHCQTTLEVVPSRAAERSYGIFCTLECYGAWLSATVVGPDRYQWEGGSFDYGQKWWPIRRQALERDGYACQHFGADRDDLGRNPDVHHLQPVRSFDRLEDAHTLDNVVTLCRSCHRRAEAGSMAVSAEDEK